MAPLSSSIWIGFPWPSVRVRSWVGTGCRILSPEEGKFIAFLHFLCSNSFSSSCSASMPSSCSYTSGGASGLQCWFASLVVVAGLTELKTGRGSDSSALSSCSDIPSHSKCSQSRIGECYVAGAAVCCVCVLRSRAVLQHQDQRGISSCC